MDASGILMLGLLVVERDDSEVDLILAHQRDGQAGKSATEQHEAHGNDIEHPQCTALGLGGVVVVVVGVEGIGGPEGSRSGGGEPGKQRPGQT